MANHTPGPWTVWKRFGVEAEGALICTKDAPDFNTRIAECEANARLIAAAPDLLAACVEALWALSNLTSADFAHGKDAPARTSLSSAIAKAEGVTRG